MKKILSFLFLNFSYLCFSQIGIGTMTPRGALDLNSPDTNIYGLVLPTNSSSVNMQNPQGGNIAIGTMMYDSSSSCLRYYKQGVGEDTVEEKWSNCLLTERENPPSIDYITIDNSFTGSYKQNIAMTSANTYKIAVKNTSFTSITLNLARTDLELSGIDGIEVASVSPSVVILTPGQTQLLNYTLSGTPTNCGTLTGVWKKISLQYSSAVVTVNPNVTYNCSGGSWEGSVSPEYKLNGLVPGESYSGTYTIPYTNAGTCELPPETITDKGLTLTYDGSPISASGLITYTLSGTYTGPDSGWASFTTAGGCQIYLGPSGSCKEILATFPGSPDGVYRINPDKQGTAFNTMDAQCDMTTDGGGWTLILNYLHSANTNPTLKIRTTLPIIKSSTLGLNESYYPVNWGHANRALQVALNSTEYRFYGITNGHNRVLHFKTAHAGSLNYFKTGVGSTSGINTSYTALAGHTANIPGIGSSVVIAPAERELTQFPITQSGFNWGIAGGGSGNRWEMDNFPNNSSLHTLHRVWVR